MIEYVCEWCEPMPTFLKQPECMKRRCKKHHATTLHWPREIPEGAEQLKINAIMTTEVKTSHPEETRIAMIEVWTDCPGRDFKYVVGRIEVWNNPELFDAVREAIHNGLEPKEE